MTSWCRIRLRSERKMRNRNDSEGDCEVVEELRATYSERKREDEKTGTAEKWMQGTQSDQHQPESIERCDACGIGDDLQLCGKPDSHQPGNTGNQIRSCQSGDGHRAVYPGTDGSAAGSDTPGASGGIYVRKRHVDPVQSGRGHFKFSGDVAIEADQRIFHDRHKHCRRCVP